MERKTGGCSFRRFPSFSAALQPLLHPQPFDIGFTLCDLTLAMPPEMEVSHVERPYGELDL